MDEKIIAFVQRMENAWNAGDYATWGGSFAEEADFINIFGGHHHGRETITASHKNIFGGVFKHSHNELTVETTRHLGGDLHAALVFTHLVFSKGEHDGRMGMVLRETADTFEIVWFQNTFVTRPEHHKDAKDGALGSPSYKRDKP